MTKLVDARVDLVVGQGAHGGVAVAIRHVFEFQPRRQRLGHVQALVARAGGNLRGGFMQHADV
ncbi:hypothetical protein [Cupriavidus sp. D39]|uniref:hypothetical protein n=1 Tax=Cupriavidus sp. D39 TaxID=2997877 RepID=UPI0022700FEF|nr:hypothetical protein [Cupriavidus sp. D39]MCY0855213.1 hypothetical protein [Cupriavidus sp. D39]